MYMHKDSISTWDAAIEADIEQGSLVCRAPSLRI